MGGLDVAARCFSSFDFEQVGPQFSVAAQRVHHHAVTRRSFRMSGSGVVFEKDWMVNDCCRHVLCAFALRARLQVFSTKTKHAMLPYDNVLTRNRASVRYQNKSESAP